MMNEPMNGVTHKPTAEEVSVIATELNCRAWPHTNAPIVGRLYRGYIARVVFEGAHWLCVLAAGRTPAVPESANIRCWIAKRWTTPYTAFAGRAWPTNHRHITQRYGANPQYYRKFGLEGHEGVDIRAPEGSPVYTLDAGRVKMIYENPLPKSKGGHNYGKHIRIGHSYAYETIYAHLSTIYVSLHDLIAAGDVIGLAGNTGNSFGAHLHLTLKKDGQIINPEPLLKYAQMREDLP